MARWDYDLKELGKELRELLDKEDSSKENCEKILKQVISCCKFVQSIASLEDIEWYEIDLQDLIQDCEDTQYYLDEYDEESNEDNVNDVLETFYDLMDSMRVWVAL